MIDSCQLAICTVLSSSGKKSDLRKFAMQSTVID